MDAVGVDEDAAAVKDGDEAEGIVAGVDVAEEVVEVAVVAMDLRLLQLPRSKQREVKIWSSSLGSSRSLP